MDPDKGSDDSHRDRQQQELIPPSRPPNAIRTLERVIFRAIPWLPPIRFCVLAYSAASALLNSKGDPNTRFFVVGSVTLVALLHLSMSHYDRNAPQDSPKNSFLKLAFWIISVALTLLFSHRVTTMLDSPALHVFVWSVAALTIAFGFYFLFLFRPT